MAIIKGTQGTVSFGDHVIGDVGEWSLQTCDPPITGTLDKEDMRQVFSLSGTITARLTLLNRLRVHLWLRKFRKDFKWTIERLIERNRFIYEAKLNRFWECYCK